ncbi:hypothetical protein L3V83_05195 [Thiotrichales bacterium 19X7-9]|nr:hypothetical protein [Thiotrichales bacterium 19X7-9]
MQQYPETAQYNPDFMIINRGSKDPLNDQEIAKIKGFLLKHNNKVVIKTEDVLGTGNIFTNDMGVEATLDVINDALAKGRPFVIEQQKMLTRTRPDELEEFKVKHQQADKTGIARRL